MYRDVLKIFLLYRLTRSVVNIDCAYVIEYLWCTILGDFAYISYLCLFIYVQYTFLKCSIHAHKKLTKVHNDTESVFSCP